MEGPGCQGGPVMARVRAIESKEGSPHPRDRGHAEEKPQRQGGAEMRPVCDADWETGTPLTEVSPRRKRGDSGYPSLCTSPRVPPPMPDTPLTLPEPGGQDSPGPRPGAVDGTEPEGQTQEGPLQGQRDMEKRRGSELGPHQETERGGEDAESGGEMLLWMESPDRREAPKEGSGTEGERGELLLPGNGDKRIPGELQQDTERREDAESGGEMLLGRESPDRREALKEAAGTEGGRGELLLPVYGDKRVSGELQQDTERREDAESGGGMLLWMESPDSGEALKEGAKGEKGELLLPGKGDKRVSGELQQDTERREDAESEGEMLRGRESPDRTGEREWFGTEQTSLIPRTGPAGSTQTPPGEEKSRKWKRLPPTETVSSRVLLVLCAVCALLLLVVVALAALTGHYSSLRLLSCPMDWLLSGNRCYYFSTMYNKEGDWDESQRICSSHNGSLALFDTQKELNFLMVVSCEHHVWVGLRKRRDGIQWANGTTCSSSLCTITDFGECAYIGSGALWVSGCHLPRPYICTKRPYD
ncbi:uncharacterized protein LOC144828312 [Lissotriton helveticus]